MHCSSIFSVAFLALALPLFTTAEHRGPSRRHHNELANRKRTSAAELMQWHKRDAGERATFYDVGTGACGKQNVPSDFIVALNSCAFGGVYPSPHCFQEITITYQGKSTQAKIMDECPGCPCNGDKGGLDFSTGLFQFFAPLSTGVIYVQWSYNGGGGGGDASPAAPAPDPAPTTSKNPKPTSTWTPPAPTSSSTWVDPSPWTSETTTSTKTKTSLSSSSSSTSWSSSSSSASSSISHNTSSTSSTPSAYATPAPASVADTATTPQNLQGLNSLVAMLGKFVAQYGA